MKLIYNASDRLYVSGEGKKIRPVARAYVDELDPTNVELIDDGIFVEEPPTPTPVDMATQAELDAAVALRQSVATAATDSELASAVGDLTSAIGAKQDVSVLDNDFIYSPEFGGYLAPHTTFEYVAYFGRFIPRRDLEITLAAFEVITPAGGNPNVEVAVLNDAYAKIASSGSQAGKINSGGVKTVPIAASLEAGEVYYGVFATGAGGTAGLICKTISAAYGTDLYGATPGKREWGYQATDLPVANPVVPSGRYHQIPLLAFRES